MTTTNNTQGTNNQNLGGNNMNNVINQIGALYSQLSAEQMQQVTMTMLQGILADPNRDVILAQAGYVAPQSQAPTVDPNMVQVDAATFNGMVNQMAQLQAQVSQLTQALQMQQYAQQQPVQPQQQVQYNNIDAEKLARIQQIEAAIVERTNMYNQYVQWGFNTYPVTAELERLKKEYSDLTGQGVVNRVTNGLNAVGTFGQERIANEFIPNVVNTTSGVLADALNIGADLVQNLGNIAVNTTAQVLQTGATAVGQVGTVASNAGQTYANSAFGLFRK